VYKLRLRLQLKLHHRGVHLAFHRNSSASWFQENAPLLADSAKKSTR